MSVQELFPDGASGEKKNAWPVDDAVVGGWLTTGDSTAPAARSGMPSMAHILEVPDQL
jgi:hypothetical protein